MEKIRKGERQKRQDAGARKGKKVAKHYVFEYFVVPGDQKVSLVKRRVQS